MNQHLKIVDENIKRAFEGYHFDNGSDLDPGITQELRVGDLCPKCKSGKLDYDGLLTLSCVECGFALAGCFT